MSSKLSDAAKPSILPADAKDHDTHIQKAQGEVLVPPKYEKSIESDEELRDFLDEKQILKLLPISRRTLFSWRESKKIPCIRVPGSRRVIFHWPSVKAALLRQQLGGIQ